MYLLAPFILQNFKKILRADPELWGCAIFGPKMAHLSWTIFFGTNHYYYFHLTMGPFHCAKFKKLLVDPELWGPRVLGPKMVHLPQTNFFFLKIINITLIYLSAPFIAQNFKKILPVDPKLRGCTIIGPKIAPISWNENFFTKPVNKPCFFHSCLSTCQKSKSDIHLLLKYWRLKNTEILLTENNFWL